MEKVKIGFLPLYVKLYDDGAPNMRVRIDAFAEKIANLLGERSGVELIKGDVCRLESEFNKTVCEFEKAGADCIVTLHLAYSPSLESEKVLKKTKLPIIILDTTPNFDFTDDDDLSISYNHGIHGVQDMCNLLVRNKKRFFIEAGHYEKSDVIDRVIKRAFGVKVSNSLSNAKVGRIGGEFAGMGDFCADDGVFEKIGIKITEMSSKNAHEYMNKVTEAEIDAQIKKDAEKYDVDSGIDKDFLRNSIRGDLAVRRWIEDNDLTAFTANFLNINKDFGLSGMPFAEANRAMERGIGYAGEGDVLTAAFVGALMSVCDQTSFVEMFCPDWKNDLLFISHMGEMNTALAAKTSKYMVKPMKYADVDTTWLCGTYKSGTATLIDLAPMGGDKFRVIASKVEMREMECEKFRKNTTCGWFSPDKNIGTFLEDYSKLGGTHHLALVYGDMRKTAEVFAAVRGFEYFEI
ncbi:MAG: hypothetical protein J5766_04945 [Clostridia bacterium]|nr:hypothetical protein [Clostridia bacterium]